MLKNDLKKISGLSIKFEGGRLICEDLNINDTVDISVNDIRAQLLNQELSCPEIFYTKYVSLDHENVYKQKEIVLNVYIIPSNLAGIEYVKTKASISSRNKILETLNGAGVIVMQNYSESDLGDIVVAQVKKGSKIIVPAGYTMSIVNTRQSTLIVEEITSANFEENYDLDDMNGMAYYIIRKNAKQEIVRNPMYKMANKIRRVNWEAQLSRLGVTLRTPIIKQILRKYERFSWLFSKNPIIL